MLIALDFCPNLTLEMLIISVTKLKVHLRGSEGWGWGDKRNLFKICTNLKELSNVWLLFAPLKFVPVIFRWCL